MLFDTNCGGHAGILVGSLSAKDSKRDVLNGKVRIRSDFNEGHVAVCCCYSRVFVRVLQKQRTSKRRTYMEEEFGRYCENIGSPIATTNYTNVLPKTFCMTQIPI